LGKRRADEEQGAPGSDNAALAVSGWAGALLMAVGVAGLYFEPGALLVWVVLIVFGVTAMPMAFRTVRRDRAAGRGRRR
jgi:Flp pilus assembly protein TadB